MRPRALSHRGSIQASGYFFDTLLVPEMQARARILAIWQDGAKVYRIAQGLLLELPATQRIDCRAALGTPLVRENGLLLAAPLAADELKMLAAPLNSLVLVRGGIAEAHAVDEGMREETANWIDTSVFQIAAVRPLADAPDTPKLLAPPVVFDARAQLQGVPPASDELIGLLTMLQGRRDPLQSSGGFRDSSRRENIIATLLAPLTALFSSLVNGQIGRAHV